MNIASVVRATWRGVAASLLAMSMVAGSAARAEPTSEDRIKRAALIAKGARAAQKKDFPACIDAYAGALQIEETAAVLGELGLCEASASRNIDAYHHLVAALRSPALSSKDEAYRRFDDGFARVGLRIAQVFIAVDPPSAAVIVDGRPLGKADGRRVPMEPGPHTIAARLDGYEDKVEPVSLEAGSAPTVHLVLVARPKAAPVVTVAPRPAQVPPPAQAPGHTSAPAEPARPLPGWRPDTPPRPRSQPGRCLAG